MRMVAIVGAVVLLQEENCSFGETFPLRRVGNLRVSREEVAVHGKCIGDAGIVAKWLRGCLLHESREQA